MRHARNSILVAWLLLLSVAVRAQGFAWPDVSRYHQSSVYYITLNDASGKAVNERYTAEGLLGAFVGGELRGVGKTLATPAGTIFVVRVWGDDSDPATCDFHLLHGQLEYIVGQQPFEASGEATFGTPSQPIALTVVPVTGVELSPSSVSISQGGTQNVEARLLPQNHSTLVTDVSYSFTSSDEQVFTLSSEGAHCQLNGVAHGTANLGVQVKGKDGQLLFTAAATVTVLLESVHVTDIRNDMSSDQVTVTEGDDFSLSWTLLPENATDRRVGISIADNSLLYYIENDLGQYTFHAVKPGRTTVTITSVDNAKVKLVYTVTINEAIVPQPTRLAFGQATVTLSKLYDTPLTLVVEGSYDPRRLELVFATAPNGEPVATASPADNDRLTWTVRGQYVGRYGVRIRYNGETAATDTCRIDIPAEVSYENGWDWISLYNAAEYRLTDDAGDYLASLNINASNRIQEIRSQHAAVMCDPTLGLFGDLTRLSAADGAYKVKSSFEEQYARSKVFNTGITPGGEATAAMMPKVEPGYTWIGYPHERDHQLATLHSLLAASAHEGDAIIGRDAFIEFDGTEWLGSLTTFEAGKGYIYYTESDTIFRLNWGDYYMPSETLATEAVAPTAPLSSDPVDKAEKASSRSAAAAMPWTYDARRYASSMPVVARLAPSPSSDRREVMGGCDATVGAFVGDECRGIGVADTKGRLFISVTGNPGEVVSFKRYDHTNGQTSDLDQTVTFGTPKGSLRAPLLLAETTLGVHTVQTATPGLTYSANTIKVTTASSTVPCSINVFSMGGHLLLTVKGNTADISSLPSGVYTVRASCGPHATTIKIAK